MFSLSCSDLETRETTCGVLGEDGRGAKPSETAVKHQLLFRLDGLRVAGVSPHQDVHHRHLFERGERDETSTWTSPREPV